MLDIDSTLVTSHSEKEDAAPLYKHGFGFYPVVCYLDGTGEALAGMLRPGNAGSTTAADQLGVVDEALSQLPVATRAADPERGEWMPLRGNSASATHAFVEGLHERKVEFSIGFPLTAGVRQAVLSVPESAWRSCIDQACEVREGAECAEVTHLLDLGSWPEGTRAICRREDPHPGAQLTFTDRDGHLFQVFITDSEDPDIPYLEARHRGHARVEDRIRCAKETGMGTLPFHAFAANQAWLTLVLTTQDLVAWAQRLCLEGDLAKAEPKRLRFALWHVAGRLVRTGRRPILRLVRGWPWANELPVPSAVCRAFRSPPEERGAARNTGPTAGWQTMLPAIRRPPVTQAPRRVGQAGWESALASTRDWLCVHIRAEIRGLRRDMVKGLSSASDRQDRQPPRRVASLRAWT